MPRYMQLRETLAAEIDAGDHPVGARFPTDLELCRRFGVSRHTVREALRTLQDQGRLVRQRGSGTVVAEVNRRPLYSHTLQSLTELGAYAAETHFEKLSEGVVVLRPILADLLGAEVGSKWLRLAGLRRVAEEPRPIGWTEIFIAEPFIGARARLVAGPEPHYDQVCREFGLVMTQIEQQVSAVAVPSDIAASLEADAASPALVVRRRYVEKGGSTFEISLSIYPADRYAYTTRLTLDGSAALVPQSPGSSR